ncbi:MAG: SUMF1/EgtB/PvdO family nonheme iron enzyme [Verrucomicrobia bacterium]|nr:SUMF1/EgtB/PvdO family nonheme iron enzyme [Verrucomicrobiota bacterium]
MNIVKLVVFTVVLSLAAMRTVPAQHLPAFPGAEGFGSFTPGGRGGKVLYVTSLEDYDASKGETPISGSLRQAIETQGPRTILFKTSGTIFLKSVLVVKEPFLTIAGQTAPGDGICIARYTTRVEAHDVIIRHVRFRLGDEARAELGTFDVSSTHDVILDHCSISWSMDENCTLHGKGVRNVTVQWSLIYEGLNRSFHPKGEHGHGSLLRTDGGAFSIHHSVYAHNNARNPRPGGYEDTPGLWLDFRNNVVYDWGATSGYSGLERTRLNYVGNYFKPGPSTSDAVREFGFSAQTFQTKMYLTNNIFYNRPEKTANNWLMIRKWGKWEGEIKDTNLVPQPFPAALVTTDAAEVAFEKILVGGGATLPRRDAADARLMAEIRAGKGRIIDSQKEVGGWPELKSAPAPADTDSDGMPDEWERHFGLDPSNPTDGSQDADGDGYTNLEEFLNSTDPRVSERRALEFDYDAILKQIEARNAQIRSEIAAEKQNRPPDAGADGAAAPPVRKMELRPASLAAAPTSVSVVLAEPLELKLERIPAGTFLMGSPADEAERGRDEQQHQVTISRPFYMGATLVTAAQYLTVTGGQPAHGREGELPAEVSWRDGVRFCQALSRNTGFTFRLPTEAEWEYACRAGTTTPFNTGTLITTDQANFDGKFVYPGGQPGVYRHEPTPVRTFKPNAWGLYDMHGNAYQWCSDWYGNYPDGPATDPSGPDSGADRVIRGGKYGSGPRYVRSAARYSYTPHNMSVVFGFRIVMEADQKESK